MLLTLIISFTPIDNSHFRSWEYHQKLVLASKNFGTRCVSIVKWLVNLENWGPSGQDKCVCGCGTIYAKELWKCFGNNLMLWKNFQSLRTWSWKGWLLQGWLQIYYLTALNRNQHHKELSVVKKIINKCACLSAIMLVAWLNSYWIWKILNFKILPY